MEHKSFQTSYTEFWGGRTGLTFGIERVLFDEQSEFQRVQVLETDAFGRLLTLDGLVMLTEWDEFVYHEMISHPALSVVPDPRRVLVVGGGDGGTVREVLRHSSIEHVDLVEIDQMVIDTSRNFFPSVAGSLDDPRLTIHVRDGIEFVREAKDRFYDVVIVDSTDPVDFAEALFGEAFYQDCARIMHPHGVLVTQAESPFDSAFRETITRAYADLNSILKNVSVYVAHIPTYPMGTWSFCAASNETDLVRDFERQECVRRVGPFMKELQYYTPDLHDAAFRLPAFVERLFE